jgi:V/A-type H+-transporting ATPase subunit F
MRYFVLGDEDTVLGFGMVGVEGRTVDTEAQAAEALDAVLTDGSIGILIITEGAAGLVRDRIDRLLFSEQFPLVVEIPDRRGRLPDRPSLRELVNQAIGIKI